MQSRKQKVKDKQTEVVGGKEEGWRWKRKSVKLKLKINGEKWKERVCEKEMGEGRVGGKRVSEATQFSLCV